MEVSDGLRQFIHYPKADWVVRNVWEDTSVVPILKDYPRKKADVPRPADLAIFNGPRASSLDIGAAVAIPIKSDDGTFIYKIFVVNAKETTLGHRVCLKLLRQEETISFVEMSAMKEHERFLVAKMAVLLKAAKKVPAHFFVNVGVDEETRQVAEQRLEQFRFISRFH